MARMTWVNGNQSAITTIVYDVNDSARDRPGPRVSGVTVERVEAEYHDRRLDLLSDVELVADVAAIVSIPRSSPADSFVLHAPLELAARAALLPLVEPSKRELARLRIVILAASYDDYEPLATAASDDDRLAEKSAVDQLLGAIAGGDLDAVDVASRQVAAVVSTRSLLGLLSPAVLPLTAAAAHAPIFLHHLLRRDTAGGLSVELIRPLARELARNPDRRISWTDRWTPDRPTDHSELGRALAETPLLGSPGSSSIHPLMMQVDQPGAADTFLAPALGTRTTDASHEVLRSAARSMLFDTSDAAPYGWSHCLTIPQALLSVTARTPNADLGLALAATGVAAFRAGLGERPIPSDGPPDLTPPHPTTLATAAAAGHDAHVVKYILACFDAAHDDPDARSLYLAAAHHLLDVWASNGGDPDDPLA